MFGMKRTSAASFCSCALSFTFLLRLGIYGHDVIEGGLRGGTYLVLGLILTDIGTAGSHVPKLASKV
jgi:hypothetical protein